MGDDEIIDRSYNSETGELEQFTVIGEMGRPELIRATPENELLYDPEDELPFDGGIKDFFDGNDALILQPNDPEVLVAALDNRRYLIRVGGNTIETTPKYSDETIVGVRDAIIDDDIDTIVSVYQTIKEQQVRKHVVNALQSTFGNADRITTVGRGWMIDDFYIVTWEANVYTSHNDFDEGDYVRSGSKVSQLDESREFVTLNDMGIDWSEMGYTFSLNGETYSLTERELLFLTKIKWLCNRRTMHADRSFWMFADKYASVDQLTGKVSDESDDDDTDDEPDLNRL